VHLTESLKIGVIELGAHKMRSFLTMLGVIVGVGAVVAVIAIGLGAQEEALRQLSVLGTNNLRVQRPNLEGMELNNARRKSPEGITREDAAALQRVLPNVTMVVCRRDNDRPFEREFLRVYREEEPEIPPAIVAGVDPQYANATRLQIARGRYITALDDAEARLVAVLGSAVAQVLFPLEDPLGKTIRLGALNVPVVGVLERRPSSGSEGVGASNPNLEVHVPLTTTVQRLAPAGQPEDLSEIIVLLEPGADLKELADLAQRVMHRRHNGAADFRIVVPELLLEQRQSTQRLFRYFLMFIAGLSLLVGGIGIMNIMLATITQRTREIGTRRALGATRADILAQFLTEALLICVLGGSVGVGLGIGMSLLAQQYAGWPTVLNVPSMMGALAMAAITGGTFGLYPAMKAARLHPIEALRHE